MSSLAELKAKARRVRLAILLKRQQDRIARSKASESCEYCTCRSDQRVIKKPSLPKPATVLVAPAPPKNLRNHEYNLAFELGTAKWYHLPVSSLESYSDQNIQQLRFCALGTTSVGMGERSVKYVWRVKSVQKLPRHILTIEQSGTLKASSTPYWLFELEENPIVLPQPIDGFPQHFEVKLSLFSELVTVQSWSSIPDWLKQMKL